jgi:hypothetical protein
MAEKSPLPFHRPTSLSPQREQIVIDYIETCFNDHHPLRPIDLLTWVNLEWSADLTDGWLSSFINRHSDSIKRATGTQQEEARFNVPREFLELHFENMRNSVDGRFSDLIFNLDEVGSGEFEDQSDFETIVPIQCEVDLVHYPIQRKFGHSTMLVCISASGDTVTPLIIAPPTNTQKIWQLGYREGEDVQIIHHTPCYINKEIFMAYVTDILIPYIDNIRIIPEYVNEIAYLLMDNLSAHCSDEIIALFSNHKILVLTFPPHTSNLFQPLDLCFFSVFKSYKKDSSAANSTRISRRPNIVAY